MNCLNERTLHAYEFREHLLCHEFMRSYTAWTCHANHYTCQLCDKWRSFLI